MTRTSIIALALAIGAASPALAALDSKSADFLRTAIKGDNSEIMLGRQALRNPTASPAVRRYGRMLIRDHSQALQQADAMAQANGVRPPTGPTIAAQAESAKLRTLRGPAFDQEFAKYMVNDHRRDLTDFRQQADMRAGPVSKLAASTIPTLRKHLNAALDLRRR